MTIAIEQRNELIGDKMYFKQICLTAETNDEAEYLGHIIKLIEHKNNIQDIVAQIKKEG